MTKQSRTLRAGVFLPDRLGNVAGVLFNALRGVS